MHGILTHEELKCRTSSTIASQTPPEPNTSTAGVPLFNPDDVNIVEFKMIGHYSINVDTTLLLKTIINYSNSN